MGNLFKVIYGFFKMLSDNSNEIKIYLTEEEWEEGQIDD